AYDWGVRGSSSDPSPAVAVIAIDDASIANLGRWPWPRDLHAAMIEILRAGGAKSVGYTVMFLEPQLDPGLQFIRGISEYFRASSLARIADSIADPTLKERVFNDVAEVDAQLREASLQLDTDAILAESIRAAGNVVMAMPFLIGNPVGKPDHPLPDFVLANGITNFVDNIGALQQGALPLPTYDALAPIENLGRHANAIGHMNVYPDVDGSIRSEPLVLNHFDHLYPSMALQLAAKNLNLTIDDISVKLGEGVELGGLTIDTDGSLQMRTFFYADTGGVPAFQQDSFYDVFSGKIPAEKYRNKLVLIGATAAGVGDSQVTPINPNMPPVLTLAHSVSSILNEDFFTEPTWSLFVKLGAMLALMLYIMFAVPRLKAGSAATITIVLLALLLGTHYMLMTTQSLWLQLMAPATLLVLGHLTITTKRFLVTERGKERSDIESAESNKMLGLSFQSQGQLDMAFEKFRKVPLEDAFLETLYNLALDFERKRQFNKAGSVYSHMASHNAKFKDIGDRIQRAKAMEETVILGGAGASSPGGTMVLEGSGVEKPKLGRYEVDKELGKGAMGVVYLGKDPKISRVVAIKTMALSQEFEADELEDVKERFFREAETAGRLSHPNIVTIFDAGEEHDLAYIAMEFLKGEDLARFTKTEGLLPLRQVLSIIERSADALNYAHQHNVVHRDIKPANIMYESESDDLKITDFGIARITDSSKTKTGMVLGTPSYMSPEQIAGKRVDGRSDLFSLGVMLYQMSTGQLPFTADSMATLMYKIANEPHDDPTMVNLDLPPCVSEIIDRSLHKDVDSRYQTGGEMAQDIRRCRASLGEAV
ncbi:MAG: serine/threonine-protein kinase, partial [Gammaproteobacteria bacterium]|nr:serine/threonine-protein kinase [Gammaproteobacteria bacterium]